MPPITSAGRTVTRVAVLLAAGAITMAARPVFLAEGLSFKYTVTSSSSDKARREATNVNAQVRIQDGNIRMDYTDGRSPIGQKNVWLLVMGDTKQFAFVNDKDKQAMVMDAATFGSGAGALLSNPLIKVKMSDIGFSYEDLGPGSDILGYKTRHLRVINRNTVEVKVAFITRRNTTVDTTEQWVATDIGFDDKSLESWAKAFGAGLKSTSPELADAIDKYNAEYGRKGMVLKSVTYSTITDQKGKVTRDTVTMLVTDLQRGPIDPAALKIPEGYEVAGIKPPQ